MYVSQVFRGFRIALTGLVSGLVLLPAAPALAQDLVGPRLAAASNFGQGWRPDIFEQAGALPVGDFRDAVYWDDTDPGDGTFVFETGNTLFPDLMAEAGMGMSQTVNNGHPAYDGGVTPYTEAGVAAFARHAAEMVRRFPAIHTVEVGNEINSANFVSGPVKDAGLEGRAAGYLPLLIAVHDAVAAIRPEVRILGGGVHSIPVGYLEGLMSLGAGPYMDALAIHPYTTPAEQLVRQVAVMRQVPGLEEMPLEVTEFGSEDPDAAPGHLIRSYCQMALAGVTRIVWYALNERGDGLVPLIDETGAVTKAGQAYRIAQDMFEDRPMRGYRPDPFTYGCVFDRDTVVLWGMPRDVALAEGLRAMDATGAPLAAEGLRLSETEPLIITADWAFRAETDIKLGPQSVVADSYHQFAFPAGDEAQAEGDPFARFARSGNGDIPLRTMPGQERDGTLWTPYRGSPDTTSLRLTAETLLPGGTAETPTEIVHRYVADGDGPLSIETGWRVPERSPDGIEVTIRHNDEVLLRSIVQSQAELTVPVVTPAAGDTLSIAVGPNLTASGDVVEYRITLRRR